jgi:glycosyltransferase involved in cell wall biosynthesis
MKKISILYLIDQLRNMGGAEGNLVNILSHLDPQRFGYSLYTFQLESPLKELLHENNLICNQIPYPTSISGMIEYLALARKIRSQEIDILHSYFESSDIWGTLLAKLAGIPVIISSKRDLGFLKSKKVLLAYRLINPFITKVISVSEAVKHQVTVQEHVSENKIVTIYNGVDLGKFSNSGYRPDLREKLGLNPYSTVVGLLANIKPIKGIEFFIQAAAKLVKQFPETQFIIIGGCLPTTECQNYFQKLQRLVTELRLEKHLFFLGERSDIPELLSLIDISVLTSLSEGFSNTVIESMAAAKPLVVSDVGGNSEAVVHQQTGFVVPPKNVDKLVEAIIILLTDRDLAERMGRAGQKRAQELFSMETMISKIEELYYSTLN